MEGAKNITTYLTARYEERRQTATANYCFRAICVHLLHPRCVQPLTTGLTSHVRDDIETMFEKQLPYIKQGLRTRAHNARTPVQFQNTFYYYCTFGFDALLRSSAIGPVIIRYTFTCRPIATVNTVRGLGPNSIVIVSHPFWH